MFHIALYEPRIAPNTGNIIRLIANNGCQLHLIEPLGFDLEEKKLRRAGLDYRDLRNVTCHANYQEFLHNVDERRVLACTTKGSRPHDQIEYQKGDVLLFGSETSGLPSEVMESFVYVTFMTRKKRCYAISFCAEKCRAGCNSPHGRGRKITVLASAKS